jgi:Na+-driven multidrug efflux pump
MIGRCVNTVTINGVLDGGGDTLFDMYSLAVCMWGIAIPLALLGAFVFGWPVLAVYACTCLDEVGKIPWVMARFRKYKWVQDLTRRREEIQSSDDPLEGECSCAEDTLSRTQETGAPSGTL